MHISKKAAYLLAAFVLLLAEIILSIFHKSKDVDIKSYLEAVTILVSIMGFSSETKKNKRRKTHPKVTSKNYNLIISFRSGVYGGLIGGVLSGVILAIPFYYSGSDDATSVSLTIIPFCAMVGCLFGGLIALGRKVLVQSGIGEQWANFFGCVLGCVIAGSFSGMLGMWLFGDNGHLFVGYNEIILGSIIGAVCLILGCLIYDYEGKISYMLLSVIIALVLSAFVCMIGYLMFYNSDISDYLERRIYSKNMGDLLEGGLVIGLINGLVFGLVIGFTVILYKYLRFSERQQRKAYARRGS